MLFFTFKSLVCIGEGNACAHMWSEDAFTWVLGIELSCWDGKHLCLLSHLSDSVVLFLRLDFNSVAMLASNSRFPCLRLLNAGISDVLHPVYFAIFERQCRLFVGVVYHRTLLPLAVGASSEFLQNLTNI